MASVVLDASALLAYVKGEPGAEIVAEVIGDSVISTINLAEVVTKLVEKGMAHAAACDVLRIAELDVADFDRGLAESTGGLVLQTKSLGLSLGDRACLSLAAREGLPVVTADRIWKKLSLEIEIRLIR